MVALLGVGYYASRQIKGSVDYAVGGRSFGLPVLLGTLAGSVIGASATMGKAGKAYEVGFAIMFASAAYFLGYLLLAWLAPKLRAANIDSLPDVLERRFGSSMRLVAAVVLLLVVIPVFGIQLIACGLIVVEFMGDLGISYAEAVGIAALIIVLYTMLGGLLAVAYTDLVQVLVMALALGVLLPLMMTLELGETGQLSGVLQSPTGEILGGMNWGYVLSFIPAFTAFVVIDPGAWQRIAAARRASDLRPAMLLTAAFYLFWSLLVACLGVAAFNLYPDLMAGDAAIPQLVMDFMPPVLKGLCLAAIIALIMSTADSALLICGTTVSWDVVRVLRPNTADKTLLLISRLVILVVGLLGILFALSPIPLFEINLIALGLFVSGLFAPVMAALFYHRVTSRAAIVASGVGVATVLGLYAAKFLGGYALPVEPIFISLTLSLSSLFIVSRLTYREEFATTPVLAKDQEVPNVC
ncbi:sodium:solute symporter family protein [Halieaceae bacterium IMCC14734]|uniref:Sodium:solute symporter family protein n=2 Tax=Candidatus Litorirhabdus singularis TaxID=2518993 RepID=A0ABT3THF2_9GAMM|nr:sodium:solute symporter family protein [Candidatus Litorirhabdus singularis]